jgi:hypothetical protein
MKGVDKICLSCKYFRLESVGNGICRVDKDRDKNYPVTGKDDNCAKWQDCGQQYFIRLGWLKSKITHSE